MADHPLPIDEALPDLTAAMRHRNVAVLVAPPGAGKTTRVPLILADEPWARARKILVLEPRRLAARAASTRMAATLGEAVGETVGYRVRFGSKVSRRTRIELVTEGVFTRMILDGPMLDGIAAVLFDEFHERSLEADLGLALARDVQQGLREDLKLLVMSATLDGARIAQLLGNAPVIESAGRAFPVETRYVGRDPQAPIERQAADAVLRALRSDPGSLLVFLPGAAEIARTETLLRERVAESDIDIVPLYGALDAASQDRAIAPAPPGRRKVVLATSIAETSLTIEGVRIVIDSGLARVPRYEPDVALTRLETVRVTRAAADQRRGRAGRTAPGICYRLWDEPQTAALEPYAKPEILVTDLAGLTLDLAQWGAEPASLPFLDPPPAPALTEAKALLRRLGALDAEGRITEKGKALRRLPLPPRLARMVADAALEGGARLAAEIAAVLSERGLGGADVDLSHRLDGLRHERSRRAEDARKMAQRWADMAAPRAERAPSPLVGEGWGGGSRGKKVAVDQTASPPSRTASRSDLPHKGGGNGERSDRRSGGGLALSIGATLALAYPDRIAKNRGAGGTFLLANGRGAYVDPASSLARESFLAVAELAGSAAHSRILLAAPITLDAIEAGLAGDIESIETIAFDAASARLRGRNLRRLGAIALTERAVSVVPTGETARALADGIVNLGLDRLPWTKAVRQWRDRVMFLHRARPDEWPDFSDAALAVRAGEWLVPALLDKTALAELTAHALANALEALLPWPQRRRLEAEAPTHFEAPTGSRVPIDYTEEGPKLSIRVQELFGLDRHPSIAGGRVPLVVELLSPAQRPVQVTRDLPGFWRGSYAAVKAEMKGRYPRHPWPDDPLAAPATRGAKRRAGFFE